VGLENIILQLRIMIYCMEGIKRLNKLRMAVFASGRGSNFKAIYQAVKNGELYADIALLLASSASAGALDFAREKGIPAQPVNRHGFETREEFIANLIEVLQKHETNFIVLAGYLKKIPEEIIKLFPGAITNIHPGLLPAFGGKGMYGERVHKAVLEKGCKISGVTVHLVDAIYDHGPIVAQRCVEVFAADTPGTLAERILKVEHQIYPEVLEDFARGRVKVRNNIVSIQRNL